MRRCSNHTVCPPPPPPADDRVSVRVDDSGWAWMVCGELLVIWKICQTVVAKVTEV